MGFTIVLQAMRTELAAQQAAVEQERAEQARSHAAAMAALEQARAKALATALTPSASSSSAAEGSAEQLEELQRLREEVAGLHAELEESEQIAGAYPPPLPRNRITRRASVCRV